MRKGRETMKIASVAVLLMLIFSLIGFATQEATASRSISPDSVLPGGTFRVTVGITVNVDLTGLGLDENVPGGWAVTPVNNGGGTYCASETSWLWVMPTAGYSTTVVYDVTVPGGAAPGSYPITGVVKATTFSYTVGGENSVTVLAQQYTLLMQTAGGGHTDPAVGSHTYDEGTVVTLTAIPDAGWLFDHWSGDVTGSTNPTSITMNGNKQVVAHFVEIPTTQYTLTMAVVGSGSTSPAVGSHTYNEGTVRGCDRLGEPDLDHDERKQIGDGALHRDSDHAVHTDDGRGWKWIYESRGGNPYLQ
jgi:hypothetical protein